MPGRKYEYQSVVVQFLGLALRKATGKNCRIIFPKTLETAQHGISCRWSTDERRIEKVFCFIHATLRNFAKIGQLIMQNGSWEGKQLISKEYCKASYSLHIK